MLALLRFIAIFFLSVVLLSYVIRFLLRIFLKRMQKRYNNQYNQSDTTNRKEGEVHVSQVKQKDKIVDNNVGDYIDYEEVDN
jgi:hypothetical protein